MSRWTGVIARLGYGVERQIDGTKHRFWDRYGRDALVIAPYLTYGTREKLLVKGRVLESESLTPAGEGDTLWDNLRNTWRRFESDEIRGARVRVTFGEAVMEAVTDEEGFFELWLPVSLPEGHDYLQEVGLELLEPLRPKQTEFHFQTEVVVPSKSARFGIISDVDDTVLQTGATDLLAAAKKTFLGNARTRLPFEGVAGFYKALHGGTDGDINPLFYVSSSPWNLYDVLVEFFELNDIPLGPLMLRDWGLTPTEFLPTSHGAHKLEVIQKILSTYPQLPFILIGDSGQEDPEIYHEIVHNHPDRILGVYIRDVSEQAERKEAIQALAEEVARDNAELVLVPDTVSAARHAAARGWIPGDAVPRVQRGQRGGRAGRAAVALARIPNALWRAYRDGRAGRI